MATTAAILDHNSNSVSASDEERLAAIKYKNHIKEMAIKFKEMPQHDLNHELRTCID